jgi:hypothetical protein
MPVLVNAQSANNPSTKFRGQIRMGGNLVTVPITQNKKPATCRKNISGLDAVRAAYGCNNSVDKKHGKSGDGSSNRLEKANTQRHVHN